MDTQPVNLGLQSVAAIGYQEFVQGTPATIWQFDHMFGINPVLFRVWNTANQLIPVARITQDTSTFTVQVSPATAGKVQAFVLSVTPTQQPPTGLQVPDPGLPFVYATPQDYIAAFGEEETRQITNRGTPKDAVIGVIDPVIGINTNTLYDPLTGINIAYLTNALIEATAEVNSYIFNRYKLPLYYVPPILKQDCLDIARYRMASQGFMEDILVRYERAIAQLKDIQKGAIILIDNLGVPLLANPNIQVKPPEELPPSYQSDWGQNWIPDQPSPAPVSGGGAVILPPFQPGISGVKYPDKMTTTWRFY